MTEVVALVDHQARQAGLARLLTAAFRRSGLDLRLSSHQELAAEVSIEQPPGDPPLVEPDRPLLWLSSGDAADRRTPDDRFLAAENYAAARSIAMLSRSPVLNRPTDVSGCGLLPPSSVLAVRRARRIPGMAAAVRSELFTATLSSPAADDEHYDYATAQSSYGSGPDPVGPFRRRAAPAQARQVKVVVVGNETITSSAVPPATLEASRRIAAFYALDLATVWWLVDDSAAATLARIDSWLWDAGLDRRGADIAAAVVDWVCDRVPAPGIAMVPR